MNDDEEDDDEEHTAPTTGVLYFRDGANLLRYNVVLIRVDDVREAADHYPRWRFQVVNDSPVRWVRTAARDTR